ncbi:MAG TPA: hypothetical protein VJU15_15495 [Gemmatimonadales bacterium]|nr:hypothetical protein [Gemmatimonadales bacterium]
MRSLFLCTVLCAPCSLAACRGVSPLGERIPVGTGPFAIIVGEGADNQTDLFAFEASGGEVVRLTFTRGREAAAALHPAGVVVAFLRRDPGTSDSSAASLVALNLLNSSEREAPVPAEIGVARRIGWSPDGSRIFVLGDSGIAMSTAPPTAMAFVPVDTASADWPAADSATAVLFGTPAFARLETCAKDCIGSAAMPWCVVTPSGTKTELGRVVSPFRWGSDSLAYIEGNDLIVRPLGGGKSRVMEWSRAPLKPRDGTYWTP